MHELAVTQSILEIATRHARMAGAQRIRAINLVVGDLTGFVDESIQFYFDFLAEDTPAGGAHLRIQRVAPRARCRACGCAYAPPVGRQWCCPACNAPGGDVMAGSEFYVASIEVE